MSFHLIDIIIIGLILFLSIRGLVNGFSKELFNFLALIGGIAVAARTHATVGTFISKQNILPELSLDFQKLIGFTVVLILILIIFNIISSISKRFSSDAPGFISRFLGYIISIARYIAIFSLIIFGINNADFLREKLSKHYKESILFKPMVQIGGELLNANQKLENNNIVTDNNTSQGDNNITIEQNSSIEDNSSN